MNEKGPGLCRYESRGSSRVCRGFKNARSLGLCLSEELVLLLDRVGPFPITRDRCDGRLLATLGKGVVHLRLEMITKLFVGDACRGYRGKYGILALDLADPVEEGAAALTGAQDLFPQCSCPVGLQCLLPKPFHEYVKGNTLQRILSGLKPSR